MAGAEHGRLGMTVAHHHPSGTELHRPVPGAAGHRAHRPQALAAAPQVDAVGRAGHIGLQGQLTGHQGHHTAIVHRHGRHLCFIRQHRNRLQAARGRPADRPRLAAGQFLPAHHLPPVVEVQQFHPGGCVDGQHLPLAGAQRINTALAVDDEVTGAIAKKAEHIGVAPDAVIRQPPFGPQEGRQDLAALRDRHHDDAVAVDRVGELGQLGVAARRQGQTAVGLPAEGPSQLGVQARRVQRASHRAGIVQRSGVWRGVWQHRHFGDAVERRGAGRQMQAQPAGHKRQRAQGLLQEAVRKGSSDKVHGGLGEEDETAPGLVAPTA